MEVGTIRRPRDCAVRYAGSPCRTRDLQSAIPPDGSQSCGSGRDAGSTREYQRDSSSKRPIFSVVLVQVPAQTPAATPKGGRQEVISHVD
jgi:hypothetical protein